MKARLYVSADGCDAWEGTEARPLYTLEAAQERIERTWGFTGASGGASGAPLEGITIVVRGPGEYSGATRRWTRDGVVVEPRDPLGIAGAEGAGTPESLWRLRRLERGLGAAGASVSGGVEELEELEWEELEWDSKTETWPDFVARLDIGRRYRISTR